MRDPINPADIRVGDRVERVSEHEDGTFVCVRGMVAEVDADHRVRISSMWSGNPRDAAIRWFLLDRPDPLAEIVEVMAPALMVADLGPDAPAWDRVRDEARDDWRRMAREALAAISERWELVERGKP